MRTAYHYFLAGLMLVTGSINTLSTKAADRVKSVGRTSDGYSDEPRHFNHPFFQACGMFLGEFLCLLYFGYLTWASKRAVAQGKKPVIEKAKPFNKFLLALPACCDMTGTSLMYVGLTLTYASMFQMLRGSVVIFTGLFSVWFLGRKLENFRWFGMVMVLVGTMLVGSSNFICTSKNGDSAPNPTAGNIIIVCAQVVVAFQMVVEEKFISGYNIPSLQVVGLEGTFGFCLLSILVWIMYYIPKPSLFHSAGTPDAHFEDAYDAFLQLGNSWQLIVFTMGNIFSIAFFNYAGVSITKHLNAATRMVLDSVRTVVIWGVSLALGWQSFCWMQAIGFVVLLSGTIIYNDIHPAVRLSFFDYTPINQGGEDRERLLDSTDEGVINSGSSASSEYAKLEDGLAADSPLIASQDMLMTPTLGRATAVKQR